MTGYLVLLGMFILCGGYMLFAINHQIKSKKKRFSPFAERKKLKPYEKHCGQEYVLDRESGKFFYLDYETPVEELSGIIAQTDLYHDCFLGFSGKLKVRITHFFYSEDADQVIAICRADLSLVLNFEKKACNQYFLYDEHLKIFLQVGPKRDGVMEYFYPEYAHEIGGGKFKLEIMLRSGDYAGQTNIYLKRDSQEYFNGRYN